jgi:small subunit ribosomal protein S6
LANNVYEGMYILDSNRYGRDPAAVSNQVAEMIQKAGGEILVSRLWEERRLAYPVRGHRKGTYWLTYFRLDGRQLVGVRRQCQISDNILRVLFLKVDPRIVDAMVEHAKAGPAPPPARPIEREGGEGAPKAEAAGDVAVAIEGPGIAEP